MKKHKGKTINNYDDPQIKTGDGYDHCFVVNKQNYGDLALAGKLVYPIATHFVVQWESMLKLYPKAKFFGGIY